MIGTSKNRSDNLSDLFIWLGLAMLVLLFISAFVGIIATILLWPLAVIWAINTIVGTTIPMTFTSWLSVIILTNLFTILNRRR